MVPGTLLKKTLAQVLPCKFCETFLSTLFLDSSVSAPANQNKSNPYKLPGPFSAVANINDNML